MGSGLDWTGLGVGDEVVALTSLAEADFWVSDLIQNSGFN